VHIRRIYVHELRSVSFVLRSQELLEGSKRSSTSSANSALLADVKVRVDRSAPQCSAEPKYMPLRSLVEALEGFKV